MGFNYWVSHGIDGAFMKYLPQVLEAYFPSSWKSLQAAHVLFAPGFLQLGWGLALESSVGNQSPMDSKCSISVVLTAALQVAVIAPDTQLRSSDFPKVMNLLSGVARTEALVWNTVKCKILSVKREGWRWNSRKVLSGTNKGKERRAGSVNLK